MDKFVIRGGNPLLGTIQVCGAKNSALPCMAAAILTEDEVVLENIPQVRDIETERKLLTSMGAEVELGYGRAQHRTHISCAVLSDPVAKYEIVKTMRASSLVLGPLIARTGIARVAMPGGCAIGGRPIDLHIKGLEAMGATITQEHGYLEARADTACSGAHIVFDKITVTGTEDLLMAAVLAEGETVFENCAREPEVTDLAALLIAMGANIEGAGTSTIRVEGRQQAPRRPPPHQPRPHRGRHLSRRRRHHRRRPQRRLLQARAPRRAHRQARSNAASRIDIGTDSIRVRSGGNLKAADISTEEYPGFPTDMQAQFMALATQAEGTTTVTENIFENRFMHVQELDPHGREHHRRRPHRHRPRQDPAFIRGGHVLRSARLGVAGPGRAGCGWRNYPRPRLPYRSRLRAD